MKNRTSTAWVAIAAGLLAAACVAGAQDNAPAIGDGLWLKSVSPAEHARTNPLAGKKDAIAAGAELYAENCAHCHGRELQGKGRKPALVSARIRTVTDGDLAWILKNGVPEQRMPGWAGMSETERWQIVAYLRDANVNATKAVTEVK